VPSSEKAIGKMQDISQQGGRTVLFVSHNMAAKSYVLNVLLEDGKFVIQGKLGM
jgi:lipopolysaccharide transport system ATP-binding protein